MLVVVIDTEAEFCWTGTGSRRANGVTSVKASRQVQPIFERYNVRPTFVVDYPVSTIPEGYEVIRDFYKSGVCEVGAHLQPWDTPPFVEEISDRNSYPGNLAPEVEREKLVRLTAAIVQNIGVQPRIYKAGRYGVGSATPGILAELGYEIDASVLPGTDLRRQSRPGFLQMPGPPVLVRQRSCPARASVVDRIYGRDCPFSGSRADARDAPGFQGVSRARHPVSPRACSIASY